MKSLFDQLEELELFVDIYQLAVPAVSKVSVGWHIEHILITLYKITESLERSDPGKYNSSINLFRSLFFWFDKFPKGRAKTPKEGLPGNSLNALELRQQIASIQKKLKSLDSLHPNQYFIHPYFGKLNAKHAKKFLAIHTNHHIKIIKDILKKSTVE